MFPTKEAVPQLLTFSAFSPRLRPAKSVGGRTCAWAGVALAALFCGACAPAESATVAEATLEAVRAATAKYQDVSAAVADGYARDPLDICETPYHMGRTGESGAMGIHFLKRDLLGIGEDGTRLDVSRTHTDFNRPAVLVYAREPGVGGRVGSRGS
jgi:hypothetical protein